MKRRREGFTEEEHESMGARLFKLHVEILNVVILIFRKYGRTTGVGKEAEGLLRDLDKPLNRLRSKLDDSYFREGFGGSAADGVGTSPYFGGRRDGEPS